MLLEYIKSTTPDGLINCIQTLGTPSATDVFELVDRSNHNGCSKMSMTIEKDDIIRFKQRHKFESTECD